VVTTNPELQMFPTPSIEPIEGNQRVESLRRPASGVRRPASGVWRLASGVWRLASGVWRLASGVWRLAFLSHQSAPAVPTNSLAFVRGDVLVAAAERTGALELANDYSGSLDADEQLIALPDVEKPPGLSRNDDPSEVVDLADDSRFQGYCSKPD
jgi:hypothetical protein